MSDPQFDVNQALGETYEYGGRQPLIPASYYPVIVRVVGTGSSDAKMVDVKDRDGNIVTDELGNPVQEEGGETPFVEIAAEIYEGPFKGFEITRKNYITPGRSGKAIGKWLGATHAITGAKAQTAAVCQAFGITLPTSARAEGKETAEQAFQRAVRETIARGYFEMDAAKRLAFVAKLVNVVAWDGKKVIAKIGIEKGMQKKRQDGSPAFDALGQPEHFYNNIFDGFLPLTDEKKGLPWVRAVEFPKQEATKAAMDAQATAS